jgi:hypothetical protein
MPPITVQKTVAAIVERSGNVAVPASGLTLALVLGPDGRYHLGERVVDPSHVGICPKDDRGHHLPAGHVLTHAEAERVVRRLLGLYQRPAHRQLVDGVWLYADG